MTTELFQCPSCGAPVTPRGSASVLNCPYCHAAVVVPEELRQTPASRSWSTLVYDTFLSNQNDWTVGSQTTEYFTPLNRTIADGRYRWEGTVGSKASSISTVWLTGYPVSDFHLIANCKHIQGRKGGSSWGVVFRIQDNGNYYHFHMTDDRYFAVSVEQAGEWLKIAQWATTNTVKPYGVNQLEVIAHDKFFTFLINGQIVSELEDDRFREGLVGLSVEAYTAGESLTYDFLDITLRAP